MAFESANRAFVHGDLQQSKEESKRRQEEFHDSSPQWAWKFKILEAKAALWQGLFEKVLTLLQSEPLPAQPELAVPTLTLLGVANIHIRHFPAAERALNEASRLCNIQADAACGEVFQARGLLASARNQSASAEQMYRSSLAFARTRGDSFLESDSLLNLGAESLTLGRFDEAIDRSEAAYQAAKAIDARILELVTQGNIGWAYYKLGDSDKALELFHDAGKQAIELGDLDDQGAWLMDAGYVYMGTRDFKLAEQALQSALHIEQQINNQENIYNALRALARLSLQTGDGDRAKEYAEQALDIARQSANRVDELYPLLVEGQVSALRGDVKAAENDFREVEGDKLCPVFLKWEGEHSLARLYEDENKFDAANREYRMALATFESARDEVRHEDSQLSFLTNAAHIYDDYVHFLVARGKTDEALRWADYSRARTLAEGLGLLTKGGASGPPPLDPRQVARRAGGTLFFYWLGEKQSYLWALTPRKTTLFTLPPGTEIDAVVQRYRKALGGPEDVLASNDRDGRWLYQTLIAPAQSLLKKDGEVFIIPDGGLNNLNFETLPVSGPVDSGLTLHYWIEDATISNASSLRMLAAGLDAGESRVKNKGKRNRSLLLIGNSVAPNSKYPELPKAATQMESVARHFAAAAPHILTREQATPAAYLESQPESFAYIHFVAHGTASRLSPLDSAIVLSNAATAKANPAGDSFKLYARDIIRHPVRAELVTISACYGAGERAYSGEGLVGLSWAFLRAGAHNVVAALWEASDTSTVQLMDKFYGELDKGSSPDVALRAAKLSLLRGKGFHSPFYWAPFQLYAGSSKFVSN